MDMIKYIAKRLLMALFILLGVSVIIYSLARMMPTDFVDNQYSSAVQQGTMKQEDVDRIKELYGLAMPDAYVSLKIDENADNDFAGKKFVKETRQDTSYDQYSLLVSMADVADEAAAKAAQNGDLAEQEKQENAAKKNREEAAALKLSTYVSSYDYKDYRLILNNDGTYGIYLVETGDAVVNGEQDEENSENVIVTLDEKLTLQESGTYELKDAEDAVWGYTVVLSSEGVSYEAGGDYRVADFWDKAGAILSGYFSWLGNMLHGDFGMSFKYKKPVMMVIWQNMGVSFMIAFVATILQFMISIPLGIKAARNQYGVIDYTVSILAMTGISLPTFFMAAIVIRVFAVEFGWFEVGGLVSGSLPVDASWIQVAGDMIWHMILPMTVLVVLSIGSLMRYTRTNTLEVLNADYIRTARAKGLSENKVIYRHAFRNTMIPLVTMFAGILPSLFSGAMITETVFSIPGIGKLAYDALIVADVPFIMGYNMFMAILTVIGTLLSDLMYAVVDPRVKLGK